MANLPTSPVIVPADPNIEGPNSGMNGGSSDSAIGICTDNPNPKETDWPRIVIGATNNPIGITITPYQSLVEYEADSFTSSPVGFAPADTQAAPGEVYATNAGDSGWNLTNKTKNYTTKIGDWLWGSVVGPAPIPGIYYDSGVNVDPSVWVTDQDGTITQDGPTFIRFLTGTVQRSCWNTTTVIVGRDMVLGETYTVEITTGDLFTGTTAQAFVDEVVVASVGLTTQNIKTMQFVANGGTLRIQTVSDQGNRAIQLGRLRVLGP
jgi:hypothetical protein